jgi:hypothetical protein
MCFNQWQSVLQDSTLKKTKAKDLYTGGLWGVFLDSWGIINGRTKAAKLWILSAGYGILSAEEEVVPYNITFQDPRFDAPSILKKVEYDSRSKSRMETLQNWWRRLSDSERDPNSLESLFSSFKEDDYALVVLSKDYLDAVYQDLANAIKSTEFSQNIAVISNNVNDPVAKRLNNNWLFANNKFINLPDTNSTFVNAKIAHHLLLEMFEKNNGLNWWSIENFNSFLESLSKGLKERQKIARTPSVDDEVKAYIKEHLENQKMSFSKLHRAYRDSGRACEYNRFRGLYQDVVDSLKQEVHKKRPAFPVVHEPRKTKVMFFLPDWDDRVDPLFDFKTEESFPNRDPYEHDVYHYELYGHLNCDGILVSRSVLEENKTKIDKIKHIGIHKYLRLPSNVPVLGDCGAFNYINQQFPPYETDDILEFYENLGFTYGVSIDHLIVPGVLKRKKYYLLNEELEWTEIEKMHFLELAKNPNSIIFKTMRNITQNSLFKNEILLCEETYIDEIERSRRYNLTMKNAQDFIKGHKDGNCTFTPIGAAQGWNPKSYADSVQAYQDMGYKYIALGGLARSTSKEVLSILGEVDKIRFEKTKLHVFGVVRLDVVDEFIKYGVTSADSAGMLRQAWLSSANNYYSEHGNHYAAIRVQLTENKKAAKKAIDEKNVTFNELLTLEENCLKALQRFDDGNIQLEEAMTRLMSYHDTIGGDPKLEAKYRRTLADRPWKKCQCKVCKENGIQVAIFRRNNRNRRRGFHNTWIFFQRFKELTNIA